MNINKLKA